MNDDNKIILRSFSNLKNLKTKIYKIGNIPIIIPIEIEAAIVFGFSFLGIMIVDKIIHIPLNGIYKFIGIPVAITMVLRTAKIDGKSPQIYILRLLEYQLIRKKVIERFEIRESEKEIQFID